MLTFDFYAPVDFHDGREPFMSSTSVHVRGDAEVIAQRSLPYPSVWARLHRRGRVYIAGRASAGGRSIIIVKRES